MGCEFACLDNTWFPKGIVATVRPATGFRLIESEADDEVRACLDHVAALARRLAAIDAGPVAVFGTTIEAAFAESILGPRVSYFVDENPGRIGTTFHRKPVVHPASVSANDRVVVSLGGPGTEVARRLAATHAGTYLVV